MLKLKKSFVCLLCLFLITFIGCQKFGSKETENNKFTQRKAALATDPSVENIAVSRDQKYIVYTKGEQAFFLWALEEEKPHEIDISDNGSFAGLYWSPNNEYVLLDFGNWALHTGLVISLQEKVILAKFAYCEGPYWSPDYRYIAFSQPQERFYCEDLEFFPQDLIVYETKTWLQNIIFSADERYSYYPLKWESADKLRYLCYDYAEDLEEELTTEIKQSCLIPSFADYPSEISSLGQPMAINWDKQTDFLKYKTVLENGLAQGPNFAGNYTVVTWGAGTACQAFVIIDAQTGDIFPAPFSTVTGVSFQKESKLLIVNPLEAIYDIYGKDIPRGLSTDYYLWEAEELNLIFSLNPEALQK